METKEQRTPAISWLEIIGLKGLKHEIDLPPLAAIVAPNGSGKSAVIDAITLLATGDHPDLPKTGKGVMQLGSESVISLTAKLGSGSYLIRSWDMDAKGSVKVGRQIPTAFAEIENRLISVFSPRSFLAMTTKQRAAYLIESGADYGSVEVESIRAAITESNYLLGDYFDAYEEGRTNAEFLAKAEALLIDSRKAYKRDVNRLEETVQGLMDASVGREAPKAVTAGAVQEIEQELTAIREQRTRQESRVNELKRKRDRMKLLKTCSFNEADELELAQLTDQVTSLKTKEERYRGLEAKLQQVIAYGPEPEDVEEARDLVDRDEELEEPEVSVEQLNGELIDFRNMESDHMSQLAIAMQRERTYEEQAKNAETMPCCPTCGGTTEWRAKRDEEKERCLALVKDYQEQAGTVSVMIENIRGTIRINEEALAIWNRIERRNKAQEILDLDKKTGAQIAEIKAELPKESKAERQAAIKAIEEDIFDMEHARRLMGELAELGAMPSDAEILIAEQTLEELKQSAAKMQERRDAVRAGREAWLEWGSYETKIESEREKVETSKGYLKKIAGLIDRVTAERKALAQMIMGPLQEGLTRFASSVLGGHVRVTEDLDIIYESEKGTRGFVALSGSEKAVVSFALAATLAMRTPLRVAVLDELSTLDAKRRRAFLLVVADAVHEGVLDQAIALDHTEQDFADCGWHLATLRSMVTRL